MEQNFNAESQNQQPSSAPVIPTEKTLAQSKVDEIVKYAKHDSYNKGKEDALNEFRGQTENTHTSSSSQKALSPEEIRSIAAEETKRQNEAFMQSQYNSSMQREFERVAKEIESTLETAKTKYPDLATKLKDFPAESVADVLAIANTFDNAEDVFNELLSNPMKAAAVTQITRSLNPVLAKQQLQQMSESLKLNQQAKNVKTANEPLSQIQPSPTGMDNGSLSTVKDLRGASWMRC